MSTRANSYDEIVPLIKLCKAGKLFEVQDWIKAGKPINLPLPQPKGPSRKTPLEVAINKGFHSLVQVLLEAGADVDYPSHSPVAHALMERRLDIVKLLASHGADIHDVGMLPAFETWDPVTMEWFIEQGVDCETDYPLARALCQRIKTALGVFKRHKDRFSSFQGQLNFALRYHCMKGDLKWVSLLLWAGADPYVKGHYDPYEDPDPEYEGPCGLQLVALYGHHEVFKLKNLRLDPNHPNSKDILKYACMADWSYGLKILLEHGFKPNDQENGGSSFIQKCLFQMSYNWDFYSKAKKNLSTTQGREKIEMIELLAAHGGKWIPKDDSEINAARRSLLKMTADYTLNFMKIMAKSGACSREHAERLLKTPTMKALISEEQAKIERLLRKLPED
jgi:ankyrin repeat protein